MADSSNSSLTSTSHTLTAAPAYGSMAASGPGLPSLGDIAAAISFRETIRQPERRESLLKPTKPLLIASAQIAQVALGTFAGQICDEQQERIRQMHAAAAARKKRKRNGAKAAGDDEAEAAKAAGPIGTVLKIRRVHIDGFELPQIWQQASRILETSAQQTEYALQRLDEEDKDEEDAEEDVEDVEEAESEADVEASGEDEALSGDDEELSELEGEGEDEEDLSMGEDEDEEDLSMGEEGEDDMEDMEDDEDDEDDESDLDAAPRKEFVQDAAGLNDGFFDIDEFNKQSQWFEAQDARAIPDTDAGDDDEELDWHTDPFGPQPGFSLAQDKKGGKKGGKKDKAGKTKAGRDQLYSDDEDDEDDEAPAFGDMDLDAPSGESDIEDLEDAGLEAGMDMDFTANDIYYKDFFAPPAAKRGERERPGRRNRSAPGGEDDKDGEDGKDGKPFQPAEEEVQRAIKDVRRDLFEQLSDASGDEDEDDVDKLSDVSAGDVRSRRSAHERRQAKILSEIRRLEADAIKAKKWTVSGEASASARPVNSLLEEDLDFEHIGKPVPVMTQEVTEDIEALVKRRILEQSFDEVVRRYGTGFGEDESARRGLVELDDQQSKKGLADIYEDKFQQEQNPDTYVSATDEKTAAEEREVERMWLDISAKLDALSNWQYKPRPVATQMSVVADVGTVAMEDAQPATAQGVAGSSSMLAPQEVYKPGTDGQAGKGRDKNIITVSKTGLPVARDEMTREEKLRRRRRNKERIRKSGSGAGGSAVRGTGAAGADKANPTQKDTMDTLKKAGVKVIGKKGELHDLEGNKPQAAQALSSKNLKL